MRSISDYEKILTDFSGKANEKVLHVEPRTVLCVCLRWLPSYTVFGLCSYVVRTTFGNGQYGKQY